MGTIYRTLAVLRDAGLIQEFKDGPVSRYDANIGGHDHAHCVACGRVQDIARRPLPEAAGGDLGGFQVLSHRLEVYGVCSACQTRARQAEAPTGAGGKVALFYTCSGGSASSRPTFATRRATCSITRPVTPARSRSASYPPQLLAKAYGLASGQGDVL